MILGSIFSVTTGKVVRPERTLDIALLDKPKMAIIFMKPLYNFSREAATSAKNKRQAHTVGQHWNDIEFLGDSMPEIYSVKSIIKVL